MANRFCSTTQLLASISLAVMSIMVTQSRAAEVREYEAYVNGKKSGDHRIHIQLQKNHTLVTTKSEISARILFYPYTYMFDAKETWNAERLLDFDAKFMDNRKRKRLTLKQGQEGAVIEFNRQVSRVHAPHQITSYSRLPPHVKGTEEVRVLDLSDGTVTSTIWSPCEIARYQFDGREIPCRRWDVRGGLKTELWFDDDGWLVQQKSVEQGHPIELRLTSLRQE